jgi:glycosyltransferase involved in cell wall biosynthesis
MRKLCTQILNSEEKIVDLNWGVDDQFFAEAPSSSSNEITVLSYRATAPLYNIPTIFDAIKKLKEEFPLKFIYIEFCKHPSINLDLTVCDEHFEHVTQDTLITLLQKADIMISIPKFDGFATSIMESLAMGCYPVISELSSYENFLDKQVNTMLSKIDLDVDGALEASLRSLFTNIKQVRDSRELRRQYARAHYGVTHQIEIIRKVYLNQNISKFP